jgi:hypothetical protein
MYCQGMFWDSTLTKLLVFDRFFLVFFSLFSFFVSDLGKLKFIGLPVALAEV